MEGRALLSESFAWYAALGVIEEEYGAEHLQRFLDFMRRSYLTPRSRADVPLLRANDSFLGYRKGPFAMYALREYVGQNRVDLAWRRVRAQHASHEPPFATSLDLYRELQEVTPDSLHTLLGDLLERNTFWELTTERATAEPTSNGEWRVSLEVETRKIAVDTMGAETDMPMDDLVEIGVYASEAGEEDELLYLGMHQMRSGPQTNHGHGSRTAHPCRHRSAPPAHRRAAGRQRGGHPRTLSCEELSMELQIRGVSKTYANGVRALDDVSLTIPPGMYGLLGPNGAGKSTLMRIVATLQDPDEGTIRLGDIDVLAEKDRTREVLGYLPQDFGLYPRVTAEALLTHFAVLEGIVDRGARREAVESLLRQTNLWDVRKAKLGTYSGGMRQRFGVAVALLGDPRLLIVDEPTAGLDPAERLRSSTC